jgi:putative adhesin
MRAVVIASLWFVSAAPEAKAKPADPDRKAAQHHERQQHFDFELPDLPMLPGMPELDLSEIEIQLPPLFARATSREHDPDEDEDDPESEEDLDANGHGSKVKIYKLNPERRMRLPRIHLGEDDHESDERDATAQAKGRGSATLPVKGPVTFQVRAQAGEVEVVATDKRQVSVTLSEAPAEDIALFAFGDRVEPSFRGRRTLRRGKLRVELPRGSRLDLASMSGDVTAQKIGDVRIRTMSGDVKLSGIAKADVQTISGDARIEDASGPVRLHTVSGHAAVSTSGLAPQVEFHSASGSLDWAGACAKDCHLSAETVSGEIRLNVDPKSSFELSYTSHSGELRDEVNLAVKRAPRRKHGMASGWLEATYGKGEGMVEADAFSGSLVVKRK